MPTQALSPRFRTTMAIALLAALLSGCGSDAEETSTEESTTPRSCATSQAEIVELLQSGIPTYDYEPAADLQALVAQSDAVVTGTLNALLRTTTPAPADTGEDVFTWTEITIGGSELLAGPSAPGSIDAIAITSGWAVRDQEDPLTQLVAIEDMTFVAFLHTASDAPGGYTVEVQGLVVGCTGDDQPATAVIEPLPSEAGPLSVADLADAVRAMGS